LGDVFQHGMQLTRRSVVEPMANDGVQSDSWSTRLRAGKQVVFWISRCSIGGQLK